MPKDKMLWPQKFLKKFVKKHSNTVHKVWQNALQEWIIAVENLLSLIRSARYSVGPDHRSRYPTEMWDEFDLLETNSTFYQAERVVLKIREFFLAIQYYQTKYVMFPEIMESIALQKTYQAGQRCNVEVKRLLRLFQENTNEFKMSNDFIVCVQGLETQCGGLRERLKEVNQLIIEQETVFQSSFVDNVVFAQRHAKYLKRRAHEVLIEHHHALLMAIIVGYDGLKKSALLHRDEMIHRTLNDLYQDIDALITEFLKNKIEKQVIFTHLYAIFSHIESLRFIEDRKNRSEHSIIENAKHLKHHLRRACYQHSLGREFLEAVVFQRWTPL